MGFVKAEITNKSGQKVGLLLDEEDERVAYLKVLVKRDELESVKFTSVSEKPAGQRGARGGKRAAADAGKPADKPGDGDGDGGQPADGADADQAGK